MAKKEFEDSLEATEFMEKLDSMLNDPRLKDWANETDDNYDQDTANDLHRARKAYKKFIYKMFMEAT